MTTKTKLSEAEETRRGEMIADLLSLRCVGGFYKTDWGTKTALGLFRTIARIVEKGE